MRTALLTLLGSLVLSAAAIPAHAGPVIAKPGAPTVSNVIQVSGGCGQWYYRDVYGYCRPYSYGYAAYEYPAWYGHPNPHWHYWHHRHHNGH